MLDTQRVVGARFVAGRFAEVEARRQAGVANAVFTREDIIKRNPVDAWQMLTAVASLEVIRTGSNITVESARGFDFRNQKITPCYLMIMVDGVVINPRGDAVNLNGLPAPDNIYAIEVFAGPARIPPQYAVSNNRCGLIAIWTR